MFAFLNLATRELWFSILLNLKLIEQLKKEDWSATPYGPCKEELPVNVPKPLGIGFAMCVFVDSDHVGDMITCRSRKGLWYS